MTPPYYSGFFLRIVRLGPVHTAGRPLIKCECRENYPFSPAFFQKKSKKLFEQSKILQKNSGSFVLNCYFPWSPCCHWRHGRMSPTMSALPPKADIG